MKTKINFKKINSLRLIKRLLLAVFVLITAFIVQWLFAQYNDERDLFKKELAQQFRDSKQQVTDSVILKTFIDPILKDNENNNFLIKINKEADLSRRMISEEKITKRILLGTDSMELSDSMPRKFSKVITMRHKSNSKEDILIDGTKLIYKMISSVSNDSNHLNEDFYQKTDTILFQRLLSDNLERNGLNVPMKWINGRFDDTTGSKRSILYFESNFFPKPYGVEFSGYNFYLLKKIMPQILFALISLLLSGAAFLFTYRNMKEQVRLNTMRADFISNISHELKTPVSTVKVALEALQNFGMQHDPKVNAEYLEMASQEMNRLDLLIDKILNTTLLENENLIHPEKIDLKPVLVDLLRSLQPRFTQGNATVELIAKDEVFNAMIDRFHVEGVLINLLDNSLKYAGEKPEITVIIGQDEHEVTIVVSDKGPGIPHEYMDKVFEKFFRVPKGNQHNVKGYGLGLSYVALVMHQHKGTIRLTANPEGGCKFKLHFPKA